MVGGGPIRPSGGDPVQGLSANSGSGAQPNRLSGVGEYVSQLSKEKLQSFGKKGFILQRVFGFGKSPLELTLGKLKKNDGFGQPPGTTPKESGLEDSDMANIKGYLITQIKFTGVSPSKRNNNGYFEENAFIPMEHFDPPKVVAARSKRFKNKEAQKKNLRMP